ncbi:MAG: M48 family metalloprotease [Hyphomonadaceae bacterium]
MIRTLLRASAIAFAALCFSLPSMAQGFIRDAEIEAILREYTDPILEAAGLIPEDVGLYIIGDPSLNAFVAGGQRIHLNTGLIIRAETPGQLKGVIAHETGHISGAHGARRASDLAQASRSGYLSIGLGIIAIAAGAPELGAALIANSQQLTALSFFTHTRAQESSADQAAITFIERTGESPAGIVEFFEEFRYQEVLSQARRFEYFRTHPLASDRIRSLRARAEETGLMDVPPSERSVRQMEIMHAKLIGFLEPPVVVYQRYPDTDVSEPARYARAISALQSIDLPRAISEIDALLEIDPENPYYHELKGQILFEFGKIDESVEPNRMAVELAPDQPLLMISYARSMIARGGEGDVEQGETLLRRSIIAEPENAFAWSELAKAMDKQGRRYEAQLATAERSFHVGDYVGANSFAQRAMQGLEPTSPLMRRAQDIAAVTDPRLPENSRYYRRR